MRKSQADQYFSASQNRNYVNIFIIRPPSIKKSCMYITNEQYVIRCLFGIYRPTRELFTHLETSNFDLCSALMAIEQ